MNMIKVLQDIQNRITKQNKNWLCIICGETGSGKSYTALRIGESLDPTFNINRVVFTAAEFMALLNSGTLKEGSCIVWDEAGVGIPSREWYTISNKAINYVLQTFRHENLAVIFTTPTLSYIDSQSRVLFHTYIEPLHINYREEYVNTKWLNLQFNSRMQKQYYQYPVEKNNGKRVTINRVWFYKPSPRLVKDYEEKKKDWAKNLKLELELRILAAKPKVNKKMSILQDVVKAKQIMAKNIPKKEKIKKWKKETGKSQMTFYRYNKLS